jgi:hypothetical protein
MARGGMTALDGDAPGGFWLVERLSSRALRDSLLPSRLLSLLLRSLGGSRLVLLLLGMPTSLRLSCWASSSMRWSASSRSSRRLSFGSTLSPGLYLLRSACFSSALLPLWGFDFRNISSSVVTVALGCVVRTEARHEGQVYGCIDVAVEA